MTRATLETAIAMGLKRAAARNMPPATTIADCIELALDLERSAGAVTTSPPAGESSLGLPPNPKATTVDFGDVAAPYDSAPAEDPDQSPEAHLPNNPLAPPAGAKLVSLATDGDFKKEIASNAPRPLVLKKGKLFVGNKLRVDLKGLVDWANAEFPRRIRVTPRDVDHEIELELQVRPFPVSGDLGKSEINSMIKVVYMNKGVAPGVRIPGQPSDVIDATEVGEPISVADCQEAFPEVRPILKRIADQAREMYRARPRQIVGRVENVPDLRQQFSQAMAVAKDPRRRAKLGQEGVQLSIVDDDDLSLFRP